MRSAFNAFLQLKSTVEKKTGWHFKVLRPNNAKEFTDGALKSFCKKAGILRQFKTP